MKKLIIVFFSSFFVGLYAMEVEKPEGINQEINIDGALVAYGNLRWDGDALKESNSNDKFVSCERLPQFLVDYIFEYAYPDHEIKRLEGYAHIPKIQTIPQRGSIGCKLIGSNVQVKFDSTGDVLALSAQGDVGIYKWKENKFEVIKTDSKEGAIITSCSVGFDSQNNCILVKSHEAQENLFVTSFDKESNYQSKKNVLLAQYIKSMKGNSIVGNNILLTQGTRHVSNFLRSGDGSYKEKPNFSYDLESHKEYGIISTASFDACGKTIVIGLNNGNIFISKYDTDKQENLDWKQLCDTKKDIGSLVFDNSGERLAVITKAWGDGILYDTSSGKCIQSLNTASLEGLKFQNAAFSTDDEILACTGYEKDGGASPLLFIGSKNKEGKYDIHSKIKCEAIGNFIDYSSQNLLAVSDACGNVHIYDTNSILRLNKLKKLKNSSLKRALFWKLSQRLENTEDRFDIDAGTGKINMIKA